MATPFGVSSTGFVAKTQSEILAEEVADATSLISNTLDLSPVEPLGQVLAIAAEKDAEEWELAQVGYNATNRGAAEGAQLDNIGALTGCKRRAATYSTVYCASTFSIPGTYAAGALVGFIVGAGLSGQTAYNLAAVTVPATNPNGAVNVGNPYIFGSSYAPAILFTAPLTGPTFGDTLVAANASQPGHVGAFSGQIPVSGWVSLADTKTPTIGSAIEDDTTYRARQVAQLGAQGSCNASAIAVDVINALQAAPSPINASVQVYENYTTVTDAFGLPPNTFQLEVFDGLVPNTAQDDPIIGQQIWNNKPAGISSYGSTSVTVLDSQGNQQTVSFSRPTPLTLYMIVNVDILATASALTVAQLIETAIVNASQGQPFVAYGQTVTPQAGAPTTLLPGVDVVPKAFEGVAQAQAGVVQVTSVLVGFAANPTSLTKLPVGRNSIAVLTQATLVVNCSVFVP